MIIMSYLNLIYLTYQNMKNKKKDLLFSASFNLIYQKSVDQTGYLHNDAVSIFRMSKTRVLRTKLLNSLFEQGVSILSSRDRPV